MRMGTQMYFQEEIIVDILSRLPVVSLFRFKCVSQSWNALICEASFKKKHFNHSKNDKLLIEQCSSTKDTVSFYCSSLSTTTTSGGIFTDVRESLFVPGIDRSFYEIYCSCDALFLIGIMKMKDVMFFLWNPSTRESVLLPSHYNDFFDHSRMFGLGYDPTSDDYKVIKVPGEDGDDEQRVEVLSLKTGSQRQIDTGYFSSPCVPDEYLVFVRGTFHWLTYLYHSERSIISFDISYEVFGELPLPEEIRFRDDLMMAKGITVLGGMLCVNFFCMEESNTVFDLWVMKDYGVKESWTKLVAMRDVMSIIPRNIFAVGEVLLINWGTTLRAYKESDGRSNVIGSLVTPEDTFMLQVWGCTESLISPKDCVLLP